MFIPTCKLKYLLFSKTANNCNYLAYYLVKKVGDFSIYKRHIRRKGVPEFSMILTHYEGSGFKVVICSQNTTNGLILNFNKILEDSNLGLRYP
jgi:hypothetical protein